MTAEQNFFNVIEELETVAFSSGQLVLSDGIDTIYFNPQIN